jgi:hypothetical protein
MKDHLYELKVQFLSGTIICLDFYLVVELSVIRPGHVSDVTL